MPELPEVDIIRQGLAPFVVGARIERVILNRPDLRNVFPPSFATRLEGAEVINISRRAKYLLFTLSNNETLLSHLGMSGNFRFGRPDRQTINIKHGFEKHDHVILELSGTHSPTPFLIYSDPRRFGFMDLSTDPQNCKYLKKLGPEPFGNEFNAVALAKNLAGRRGAIKAALLDQGVVAGLGNIYVCEALYRAGIDPRVRAMDLVTGSRERILQLEALVGHIKDVLGEAIASGGSTLKDYKKVDGSTGYFQHGFKVYGREGETCLAKGCSGTIKRISQSARSSFYCPVCQS
ncbi:Formamidopyrimidine-DNA glycosylase [hydrothermal vent metagenome]|uniref:Formamidopyrimidine-DNA glycosylase n=1 Tax=hydrothermal vent metagenome TaxID=652676 RepID=A0A3B0U7F7_9ZZZZ